MKPTANKITLKLLTLVSLIGLFSFWLWNISIAKVCTTPAYWQNIKEKSVKSCEYSPLPSLFSLKHSDAYDLVAVGDQVFLDKVSAQLSGSRKILSVDTCQHDLRDVVGVMNWHAKNLIGNDIPIIIQGGPQLWSNPGFYGKRLDTQPWIKSQTLGFPNKALMESCFDGLETAFRDHKENDVTHERTKIDGLKFGPNASYMKVAKRALKSKSSQIIWVDDREKTGTHPEFIEAYEDWANSFPEELGTYSMSFSVLDTFKDN